MRTRTTRFAAVALAGSLLFAACSKDEKSDTSTGGTSKPSGTVAPGQQDAKALLAGAKLVSDGKLTVCSDIPYTPFEFEDESGKLTGFDVELMGKLAPQLDLKPDFKQTTFDGIIASLNAGNCDVIMSAMTITDERKEQVAFTNGYFDSDQSLLVRKSDAGTYKTLADLKGKVIGVQSGTTGKDYAEANKPEGATIKEFESGDQIFTALTTNDVAAALQDFPVNAYRAQKGDLSVTEKIPTGEQYGIAAKKDATQIIAALDAALANVKADGTYDQVYNTWFGSK